MTDPAAFHAWLLASRPGHDWVVLDGPRAGLPMADGIMFYEMAHDVDDYGRAADRVMQVTGRGKRV